MENEITGTGNYQAVRLNAVKHGILSQHTVLPHEDRSAYDVLLNQLEEEHNPAGPTELHLVEELAGIIWRKRRVLLAEGAAINRGTLSAIRKEPLSFEVSTIEAAAPLENRLSSKGVNLKDVVTLSVEESQLQQRIAQHDLESTERALRILFSKEGDRYQRALETLQQDSREWWLEHVEEESCSADEEGLLEFIETQLLPLCRSIECGARNHQAIKAQALGEGLQPNRLEKLSRYETHLDRKFERTLAMLIKLKEMR